MKEKAYPFKCNVANWGPKNPPGDYSCTVPILAKYAAFASQQKPADDVVDDLYQTARQLFVKIPKAIVENVAPELEDAFVKADVGIGLAEQQILQSRGMSVIPEIAKVTPKERRFNKVMAVEKLIHARHATGLLIEWACEGMEEISPNKYPPFIECQRALTDIILDALAEC